MADGTDRRQPLHNRLCAVNGVAMVHALEGEEAIDRGAGGSGYVQHPVVFKVAN